MNILGPYARLRIYTSWKSYTWFFRDLFLGRFSKGGEVEKLERALVEKFDAGFAVCTPMNRVGLYLVIKNLIRPGQKVIMSPYNLADAVNMVVCAGGAPVFADIEQGSCNLDPAKVESLIDADTGAVIVTHLQGIRARVEEILEICRRHNLPLIEDAAQAFGASVNGKRLGTIGDVGIYSLGMYKNINSWYGGAVVSKNRELINKIRVELDQYPYQDPVFIFKKILKGLMTDLVTCPLLFRTVTFRIFRYGFLNKVNWINRRIESELDLRLKKHIPEYYLRRYTPFQARLILAQLGNVDRENEIRIKKAALYRTGLQDLSELVLPVCGENNACIYTVFPIQYRDRRKMLEWLMKNNRDAAGQHLKNCADLESFAPYYRDCPVARKVADEVICLPVYPRYPDSEIGKNIEAIRKFFTDRRQRE